LPGSGKTTIARELARRLGAVHIRIDSIEQALRNSGALAGPVNDAGYRVGYALAQDNLRLGHIVIADSGNPIEVTREAWRTVATELGVVYLEVEVVCSDPRQHRARVEGRHADIEGHKLPTWDEVISREYEPWPADVVADTARLNLTECVTLIAQALPA
jgi:predicted kinase